MISNWVNTARVLKALYDLSFSQEPFYVDSRADFRRGIRHTTEQIQAGLTEPLVEQPPLIRKPFKVMLYLLLALVLASVVLGNR